MSSNRPSQVAQTKRISTGPTYGIPPQQKQNTNIQSMYRNTGMMLSVRAVILAISNDIFCTGLSIVGQQPQYAPDEFATQSQPMREKI
jgi:hypothetical protein